MTAKSRRALQFIALITALCVIVADRRHAIPHEWHDWSVLALGGAMVILAWVDVKAGVATWGTGLVERAKDPVGFWMEISIAAVIGVVAVIGAAGDMVKISSF